MKNSLRALGAASIVCLALPAIGQIHDNAAVHGSYYVRYLGTNTSNNARTFISFQGTITSDGTTGSNGEGKYTLTGQGVSSTAGAANLASSQPGEYDAEPSGTVDMQNPFDTSGNTWLFGGMSEGGGIIIQSSGDTPFLDFFVAIPVSTAASNATLTAGLAPGLAGLYQINFTIPSGATTGDLEIDTVDSTNMTIRIPMRQ